MTTTTATLFADIAGGTALRGRVGDRGDEVIASQNDLLRDAAARYGGRLVEAGGGHEITFATCRAAVDCAVAIRRGFFVFAEEGLRLRIGIACGADAGGLARAIARAGATGQVLASTPVIGLAGTMPGIQFADRGAKIVEGEAEPQPVHEVLFSITRERTRSPIGSDDEAPFAGREDERAALKGALIAALNGAGSIVLISGEPGAGKTALAEAAAKEASDRGFLALVGHCIETDSPPAFMPLVEILRAASGAVPRDVFLETLGDAAAGVSKLIPGLDDAAGETAPASGADRPELISACLDFLERTSQRRPVALVLDALQWADESSVRLLESTAERIVDMPAVVIGTFREGELGSGPFAAALPSLSKHTSVMRIVLGPA